MMAYRYLIHNDQSVHADDDLTLQRLERGQQVFYASKAAPSDPDTIDLSYVLSAVTNPTWIQAI